MNIQYIDVMYIKTILNHIVYMHITTLYQEVYIEYILLENRTCFNLFPTMT